MGDVFLYSDGDVHHLPSREGVYYSFGDLVVDFNASPPNIPINGSIQFTDLSSASVDEWDWDFGDSSPHSSIQNPSHTFTSLGQKIVTFTVLGKYSVSKTINVYDSVDKCLRASNVFISETDVSNITFKNFMILAKGRDVRLEANRNINISAYGCNLISDD
jgi:PKD repeat protein